MFGEIMMELGSLVRSKSGWLGVVTKIRENNVGVKWVTGWRTGKTDHIFTRNLEKIA